MIKAEYRNINDINPLDANPRKIDEKDFKILCDSIEKNPEYFEARPVILSERTGVLVSIAGNQRMKAAKKLGMKKVPTVLIPNLTEEKEREIIIRDNINNGNWDMDILKEDWDEDELNDFGFDIEFEDETELEAKEDDYEEPEQMQVDVIQGDLIEFICDDGRVHRLLCGDSTCSDSVGKLMNGKKADIAFTSPPYNAGKSEMLSGNTHTTDNKYNSYNDNQTKSKYLDLLTGFTDTALMFCNYLICNIQSLAGNKIALIEYLHNYKNNFVDVAIWDKGHGAPAMAENVMTSAWEYLLFISAKDNASRAIPNGNFRGTIPNIYRGKPQRNNKFSHVHAATFPIDLCEWAMQFTNKGNIILDQFLGTGTTMVASHQLNRTCYGMELDEKYCQVIIDRMTKLDETLTVKINGKEYKKDTSKVPF